MSLQPLWPTRPQAIQVDLTMTRELLRVLSRGGNGHPLHHDSLYQSIYLSSAMASQLLYDWPVVQARALAPLFLSLKQIRITIQALPGLEDAGHQGPCDGGSDSSCD